MKTTKVIIPKKSKEQLEYETKFIKDPIKKLVPKAPSGRMHQIKLPAYISFTINDKTKTLFIYMEEQNGICDGKTFIDNPVSNKNMQEDNAAFEGWAICLKAWMPEKIDNVVLKWDEPKLFDADSSLHYNRFLYRVLRFSDYYDWFSIDSVNKRAIEDFRTTLVQLSNNCFTEHPKLKEGRDKSKLSETVVEYLFANYFSTQIKEYYQLDNIDRQFPVGVKKNGKSFFTGGMSAIDLWGTKNNILTIIELKYNGETEQNVKVGIISELFMYSCIMQDIITGAIARSQETINKNEKNFYDNLKQFNIIHAEMLSDKYHPLVNNDRVLDILNNRSSCNNDIKVIYHKTQYKLNDLVKFL